MIHTGIWVTNISPIDPQLSPSTDIRALLGEVGKVYLSTA